MKTIFKAAMLLASALVVFSSCLKEQTSLGIEKIPGTAKVTGTLVIWEGTDFVDGKFVPLKKPSSNTEVTVRVHNDSFTTGGAKGMTDYTAVTDENGYFECVIPAVDNGVDFSIFAPSFIGTKKVVKGDKDGVPEIDDIPGVYSVEVDYTKPLTAFPGTISDVYVEYSFKPSDIPRFFETTVPFHVYVGKAYAAPTSVNRADIIDGREKYKYNGKVLPADKVAVELTVTYNGLNHEELLVGYSDSKGFIKFDIPAESVDKMKSGAVSLSLKAVEHRGKDNYRYYTWVTNSDEKSKSKEGSCDLLAGTYTFAQSATDCQSTYDFSFFTPEVKVIMTVAQVNEDEGILNLIDDNDDNDDNYRMYFKNLESNYAGFWGLDKFEIE